MNELFEIALREKYRFPFNGWISTEDLWDLSLAQLDAVYKTLKKSEKASDEESLISNHSPNVTLQNKIKLVTYIFGVKQEEENHRVIAAENKEKRKRILDILAEKQESSMREKSVDELKKMLEDLE